jgi:hypothetical protein
MGRPLSTEFFAMQHAAVKAAAFSKGCLAFTLWPLQQV